MTRVGYLYGLSSEVTNMQNQFILVALIHAACVVIACVCVCVCVFVCVCVYVW